MTRLRTLFVLALVVCFVAPAAFAKEKAKMATDEQVKEALARFKEEYKAKGLKGDDKLMQRDFAIKNLVKWQHKLIVNELGKIAKKKDPDLSTLAVIYMAEQKDLPGVVGPRVVDAMKRHKSDPIFLMSALDTLGYVRYLGGGDMIEDLLKHKDFSVKKYAIRTAGWTQDIRLMGPLLKLLGISEKNEKQGDKKEGETKKGEKEETEGASWEGTEVEYDTGTPGDHDQKMAEKIGKAEMAAKKAAATGGKGGGGGGTSGTSGAGSGSAPRGGSSRSLEELYPTILKALKSMTGEEFDNPKQIRLWLRVNKDRIKALKDRFDKQEKEQAKAS